MFVIFVETDGSKVYYAKGKGVTYRWYERDKREHWQVVPWIGY